MATVDSLAKKHGVNVAVSGSNWAAASPGHSVPQHEQYEEMLCFSSVVPFYVVLESVATIGVHWVEFFVFLFLKLQNGFA